MLAVNIACTRDNHEGKASQAHVGVMGGSALSGRTEGEAARREIDQ